MVCIRCNWYQKPKIYWDGEPQMGLHNNHTSIFLDENKTECPSFSLNHRQFYSSHILHCFLTFIYLHSCLWTLYSFSLGAFFQKLSDFRNNSMDTLKKVPQLITIYPYPNENNWCNGKVIHFGIGQLGASILLPPFSAAWLWKSYLLC